MEQIAPNGDKTMVYQQVESIPQPGRFYRHSLRVLLIKADIIIFILIIGGAFWIVNDSKAFDIGTVGFCGKPATGKQPDVTQVGLASTIL